MADHGLRLLYHPAIGAQHLHPTTSRPGSAAWPPPRRAERAMVAKHPDVTPWFHDALAGWRGVRDAPRRGGARLVDRVPAWLPVLGPRVHAAARAHWKATLARAFFAGLGAP